MIHSRMLLVGHVALYGDLLLFSVQASERMDTQAHQIVFTMSHFLYAFKCTTWLYNFCHTCGCMIIFYQILFSVES